MRAYTINFEYLQTFWKVTMKTVKRFIPDSAMDGSDFEIRLSLLDY